MYSGYDPNSVDKDALLESAAQDAQYRELEKKKSQREAEQQTQEEEEEVRVETDPRRELGGLDDGSSPNKNAKRQKYTD